MEKIPNHAKKSLEEKVLGKSLETHQMWTLLKAIAFRIWQFVEKKLENPCPKEKIPRDSFKKYLKPTIFANCAKATTFTKSSKFG